MNESLPQSRRSTLKLAAIATLGAFSSSPALLPAAQGELVGPAKPVSTPRVDPWRGLKVGVATYSLRGLKTDAAIAGVKRVGLAYCSIKDIHLKFDLSAEERKAAAQQFRDAGVTPLSCGNVTMQNDEANVRRAFEYARDIGVKVIVCSPDPESMPLLDRMVKEFDVRLAIHNHGPEDKRFPSPYDVMKVIEKFDPRIGLCIDVGHTARAGADPAKAIRDLRERLYDVHLKDLAEITRRNQEVEVGRGVLDVRDMLAALVEMKFAGHVGFEHERDAKDPLPGLAESVGYAKGVMTALGA